MKADAASGAGDWAFRFRNPYPNLSYEEDIIQLDDAGLRWYAEVGVRSEEDDTKWMLNHHSGEARLVGDSHWQEFPATGGSFLNLRFWHAQFMHDPGNRAYTRPPRPSRS